MMQAKKEYRRGINKVFQVYTFECYLGQEKIIQDYRLKLQPGTFQGIGFSYTSMWGRGSPPPLVYTLQVQVQVQVQVSLIYKKWLTLE
jgi:hypothetical protein